MKFVKADFTDIEEISKLYDDVCDYLCTHENYPGWKKGVYPTKDDAESGIKEGTLYIAKENQKIVGTVILRHKPEAGYKNVAWASESNYGKINRHSPYLSITLHKCYPYYLFGISTFPSSAYHSIVLRKFSITIV